MLIPKIIKYWPTKRKLKETVQTVVYCL